MLLSYITAELWIRFFYDSIYIPLRDKKSVFSSQIIQDDESEFAKYYVIKLFRQNLYEKVITKTLNLSQSIDPAIVTSHIKHQTKSTIKKYFDYIYQWDDHFRYTTLTTCTYTVAYVFLYYVACTFIFLYTSQTTNYLTDFKSYRINSMKNEIILSGILTFILFSFQLFKTMKNYKKHKLQLYKGFYEEIPSGINFDLNSNARDSIHYPGFLVGYVVWGFIIYFHLILIILTVIQTTLFDQFIKVLFDFIVPILVIYLLSIISMSLSGQLMFIGMLDQKPILKKRQTHAIILYFYFFAGKFYLK
jgi:hypothetical protein